MAYYTPEPGDKIEIYKISRSNEQTVAIVSGDNHRITVAGRIYETTSGRWMWFCKPGVAAQAPLATRNDAVTELLDAVTTDNPILQTPYFMCGPRLREN